MFALLILISLFSLSPCFAAKIRRPQELEQNQGILVKIQPDSNKKKECPKSGVWGWKLKGPDHEVTLLSPQAYSEAEISISDDNYQGDAIMNLPSQGPGKYRADFYCGLSFENVSRKSRKSFRI